MENFLRHSRYRPKRLWMICCHRMWRNIVWCSPPHIYTSRRFPSFRLWEIHRLVPVFFFSLLIKFLMYELLPVANRSFLPGATSRLLSVPEFSRIRTSWARWPTITNTEDFFNTQWTFICVTFIFVTRMVTNSLHRHATWVTGLLSN